MPSAASKVIAILFLAVIMLAGPCVLILDAVLAIRNVIFIRSATVTDGTILELRLLRGSHNGYSYAPVFRFTADDEQTYILVSKMSTNPPGFTVGEHVRVLYVKGHPEGAKIDTFLQQWMPQLVLTIVGGGFSVIPAIVVIRRRRQRISSAEPQWRTSK